MLSLTPSFKDRIRNRGRHSHQNPPPQHPPKSTVDSGLVRCLPSSGILERCERRIFVFFFAFQQWSLSSLRKPMAKKKKKKKKKKKNINKGELILDRLMRDVSVRNQEPKAYGYQPWMMEPRHGIRGQIGAPGEGGDDFLFFLGLSARETG